MRKNFLIYRIIFSFFILTFSSCVNHDFDLDDDKLDTNAAFGDGISLPIGNIEKISIYDKLSEVYDKIEVGEDNVLYIKYDGTFPVEFFEVPDIVSTSSCNISFPINPLPLQDIDIITIASGTIKDVIEKPKSKDLDLVPIDILFGSCTLDIDFNLLYISLTPEANDAKFIVTLEFSDSYIIEGDGVVNNTITDTIPSGSVQPGRQIEVKSYKFGGNKNDLTYRVVLAPGNAKTLTTTTKPLSMFSLGIKGHPEISSLRCRLDGQKSFSGEIGLSDLQNAFGNEDTLEFNNPSLTLTTDLNAIFKMELLELWKNEGASGAITATLKNPLQFEPNTQPDTIYSEQLPKFKEIISTPFPEKLDYTGRLSFENEDIVLPGSVNYLFKIPFDFKKISLSLKDTITDLFNEDTYDEMFSHIDDVTIEAELENSIAGTGMDIDAVILDDDRKVIPELVKTNFDGKKLSIAIKDDDEGAKMKKARHLAFTFRLSGAGAIKKSDFIEIKNLRLVSSSGISYEF